MDGSFLEVLLDQGYLPHCPSFEYIYINLASIQLKSLSVVDGREFFKTRIHVYYHGQESSNSVLFSLFYSGIPGLYSPQDLLLILKVVSFSLFIHSLLLLYSFGSHILLKHFFPSFISGCWFVLEYSSFAC